MQAFIESRLDVGYDYGETGGPSFDTDVVELSSGHEHRNARWDNARGRWELGERNINKADKDYLKAFFRAVRGSATGFRFKDWQDFEATDEELAADKTATVQLRKTYAEASVSEVRTIKKPIASTVQVTLNGSSVSHASVDESTGILTLNPTYERDVEAVLSGSPIQIETSTDHGLTTGDEVYIEGTGEEDINDQLWTVTVVDAINFTLDGSDNSGSLDRGSIGHVRQYPGSSDTLKWSGEFDTPVRFDTDEFRARFIGTDDREYIYALSSLPVVEIRV